MLVEEVLVMAVFFVAVLAVVACFVYLVYATVLEEHLLRNRSRTNRAPAESRRRHPGHGQTAFPMGRH